MVRVIPRSCRSLTLVVGVGPRQDQRMDLELARELFGSGRSHALASDFLNRSALRDGEERALPEPELFAFNGTYSLSTHYLLGLGLELMLKAAIVAWDGPANDKFLREIGHDLVKAFRSRR